MAIKSHHKPNQLSTNDSTYTKTENKNFSVFESINIDNLSMFYNKEESQFKYKIDKLNSKFNIETDKYLTLKTEIEKTQDQLHLLLFKQIAEYIEEIERLNIKLKEKNEKEKQSKQQLQTFGKIDEDAEKEMNQFKKVITNIEKQLKETKENETKLKKENESLKRQISHYKERLNFEITERNRNKEKSENNKENNNDNLENFEKSSNFTEISQNNIISHYNSKLHPINQDYTYSYTTTIKKIDNLSEIPNLKMTQNFESRQKKSIIPNINFNENNKKNLNLISRIKNKRSISHLSQSKANDNPNPKLTRTERKDKYPSEVIHKTQISLNDQKKTSTEEKIPTVKNSSTNRKEKIKNYICNTVAKSKNLSENKKKIDVKYNMGHYKYESTIPQRRISNLEEINSANIELNEITNLFVGNLKDELTMLKNEEEILLMMRNEIFEGKNEFNFSEDSFKSFKAEMNSNSLPNDINIQIKNDDTSNYNTLNTSSIKKNKLKMNSLNLVSGVDGKLKTKIKGIKFLNSNK